MEASGSIELANNALARATQVFVKKMPEIHLFAARFRELSGEVDGARAEYQLLYSELAPGLLEAVIKHANLEYRLGDRESAFSVYEKAIAAEQEKEYSLILPILVAQFARFSHLVGDIDKAREILARLHGQAILSKHVLEAVIHLESISPSPKRIDFLDSLVERYITPNPENPNTVASKIDREELSSIFLEFLDLFGDAKSIKKAEQRHAILFFRQKSILLSRKRSADDSLSLDKVKLARVGDQQRAMAGVVTSQVQGQQWAAGYAPQVGYSGYGNFSNYAPQQVTQAVPQNAAYGVYPSTFSTQAPYPQQNYAQPAVAVASAAAATSAAYVQQPAATNSQTYYGSYY